MTEFENNELERQWKKAGMAYFLRLYSDIFL
jgi:hypothetical protein